MVRNYDHFGLRRARRSEKIFSQKVLPLPVARAVVPRLESPFRQHEIVHNVLPVL